MALYGPLVYLWARNAGLQADDAANVGQEVFRAVARKINDFRREGPGDSFRGWLRKITRRKVLDLFRRRSKEVVGAGGTDALDELHAIPAASGSAASGAGAVDGGSAANDRTERGMLLHRAVELVRSSFEERTRQAFWNVVVEGHSPRDVAANLKMSLNAVYMAKSKMLRRLRDEFGEIVEL